MHTSLVVYKERYTIQNVKKGLNKTGRAYISDATYMYQGPINLIGLLVPEKSTFKGRGGHFSHANKKLT